MGLLWQCRERGDVPSCVRSVVQSVKRRLNEER